MIAVYDLFFASLFFLLYHRFKLEMQKKEAKSQRLQNALMIQQLPPPVPSLSPPQIDWSVPEWTLENPE